MKTVAEILEIHEGFVDHAYQDHLGYWTIGIGRLIDERKSGGITREEALYLLQNDIEKVERELDSRIPWWRSLSKIRRDALVNMAFNLGAEGLMGFKNMLSYLETRQWRKAAQASQNSLWAQQVGKRALDIKHMIEHDEVPERLR